jgi:hypothetical protein
MCQWHHTAVHEGGVRIIGDTDKWVFRKPDGRLTTGWMIPTWPGTSPSRSAASRPSVINWLRWTASSTPRPKPSDRAGPVSPSTSTPACRPSSPSNSPSRPRILINKPRNWIGPLAYEFTWEETYRSCAKLLWRVLSVTSGPDAQCRIGTATSSKAPNPCLCRQVDVH